MRLSEQGLKEERLQWEAAGYQLPRYDHAIMVKNTRENPYWLHFGAGNIFRAFQAKVVQDLLNENMLDRGLIAVGDHEFMEQLSRPHDDYTIHVTLKTDGTMEKTIVGSIAEYLTLDEGYDREYDRMKGIMVKDSLQIASFTITEKGYSLIRTDGTLLPEVEMDLQEGPENPHSYMGKVTALLYARYQAGQKPIAMVSMDNCSRNGMKLYKAIQIFAKEWSERNLVDIRFIEYIENPEKVSFPWTMIDKITPRPNASVEAILEKDGIRDLASIITERKAYVAPFVNTEECQYLVIEECFPNGRPLLEKAGLIFTERETVNKVEKMKVCTCLNPLHTALAVFGCLLGFTSIYEEMRDDTLRRLVEKIGYSEGLPVVVDPGVLDPRVFIDAVLNVRFPNPFMPDTPQRIVTDTSQKLAIRFGETIKAYQSSRDLDIKDLKKIPLVFAGWLRYLTGINDRGEVFELSPDPMLKELAPYAEQMRRGGRVHVQLLGPILQNSNIFGVDLCEIGMADQVIRYLNEMLEGSGAVRATLEKYV